MSRTTVRQRVDAATPGPWGCIGQASEDEPWDRWDTVIPTGGDTRRTVLRRVNGRQDAIFIANARQDVPALLAVAEAAVVAQAGWGSILWVAHNLHNHKTDQFRKFMEDALGDWEAGYAALRDALAALEALP